MPPPPSLSPLPRNYAGNHIAALTLINGGTRGVTDVRDARSPFFHDLLLIAEITPMSQHCYLRKCPIALAWHKVLGVRTLTLNSDSSTSGAF